MSRILLVDDSTHAQRMGERILADEGYEVVTVSNADSALIRLDDVDPDVVLADTVMPGRTGFELCQYIKMSPRHRHMRVILTAGVLEPLEDEQIQRVEADGAIKKPFEASVLLATIKPLAEAAQRARAEHGSPADRPAGVETVPFALPFVTVVDAEQVKAAVTVALDAAMASMVDEITRRVMTALSASKPTPAQAPPEAEFPAPVDLPRPALRTAESVRRVSPLRVRSGSILGLDLGSGPEEPS
jgi:CheY-like chemotaxis protein